ncbi:hypothetical protein [Chryseobacterium sp. POE27]|uniref:hypothetical protein n=1 Tax=Chryseobacterium sp. POE27 TaxID=3138177 RepID=UPI00321A43BF
MKNILTTAAVLFGMTAFAQVGINNTSPKATLDITAKTGGTRPEGLIIPQLTGDQIRAATTATPTPVYGTDQKGLIIYATTADSAPAGATASITAPGYYYFDGSAWQKVITGTVANTDLATGTGGIYKGSGSLSGNTTVTQGANTLAFTSTATNGFSVDGTTLSVDAANDRLGIGTAAPLARVHISGAGGAGGDHLRMTNTGSDWALASENAGVQNGITGKASLTFVNRINSYRTMTIGEDNSFRIGGNIATGNAALSIDGPTNKVGIGINVPNATLDVRAASNGSTPEGIIAPRLSLTALQGYNYGGSQTGAIVYVNSASGTPTGQTANVTTVGYYYFDGSAWQKILNTSSGDTTNDAWTNDTTNAMVKIGTKADGTARAAGTDFVVKDDGKVGIGTATATSLLDVVADNKGTLGQDDISLSSYNSTGPSPGLIFRTARGTAAAPANLQNGDDLSNIIFAGRIGGK